MSRQETIIKAKNPLSIDFREIWAFRELLYVFTWRDIKVRYKQTLLGIIWVLFQPIVTSIIFSIFFGKIAKIPSDGLPYPLFSYAGLIIWTFFSNGLNFASNSLVESGSLIKKVYFPRIIIPVSAAVTSAIDFVVSLPLLIGLLIYYQITPSPAIIIIGPLLALQVIILVSGLGMGLAALNVRYRDVRYILPFFIQVGIFLTPVIYPIRVLEDYRRYLVALNPLSGIIEIWRALIVGRGEFDYLMILISLVVTVIVVGTGVLYFKLTEKFFADLA